MVKYWYENNGKDVYAMLHSLSFGTIGNGMSEIPTGVLNLFISLSENPSKKLEFASEIVENGLAGRIRLDSSFNIDAYENTIRKNIRLGKENKRKKETHIIFDSEDQDAWSQDKNGVNLGRYTPTALQMQDAFEQLLCEEELIYAIATIKSLDKDLQVEENIFIIDVIKQALIGIPNAVDKIKYICNKYKLVSEQLEIILGSGKSFDEMFA